MISLRNSVRVAAVGCLAAAAVLGTSSLVSAAEPTSPVATTAAAGVTPVYDVNLTPSENLVGKGRPSASVVVTDNTGNERHTSVNGEGFWNARAAGLEYPVTIQQFVGEHGSPILHWTPEPDITPVSPVVTPVDAPAPSAPRESAAPEQSTAHAFAVTSDAQYVPGEKATVAGTGTPGASILVHIPGRPLLLSTTVGTDGTWSVTTPTAFTSGNYSGNLALQESDGQRRSFDLVRGTAPVYVDPTTLTSTGAEQVANGSRPVFAGTGTPGESVRVEVPGAREDLRATVGADGGWSVASTVSYSSGWYQVTITQDGDKQRLVTSLTVLR